VILIDDGAHDPRANMERDRARWTRLESGADGAEAVMRLFRFRPFGITLGHAQSPEQELDLARCRGDGVAWAVRPTGGRAIFHAEEWTYSITARVDDPEWGGSAAESYRWISGLLAGSLRILGVETDFVRGRSALPPPRSALGTAPPCFASPARFELTRGGRKLVGSAQRRGARAFIQQGSVLLSEGHLRLTDYLRLPAAARTRARAALEAAATHAGDVIPAAAPLGLWADALERAARGAVRRMRGAESAPLTA